MEETQSSRKASDKNFLKALAANKNITNCMYPLVKCERTCKQ